MPDKLHRVMTKQELEDYLKTVSHGTISYTNDNGFVDVRPFNFGYYQGCFYFHCTKHKGEQLALHTKDRQVTLNFYDLSNRIDLNHNANHYSAIITGELMRVDGIEQEKEDYLEGLKVMCDNGGLVYKGFKENLGKYSQSIAIFKVIVEAKSGKLVTYSTILS